MIGPLPIRRVAPYPPGDRAEADSHPIEMRTLSTLDLSHLGEPATFEDAQHWHHDLLAHGIRLGQPVKCVKLDDGRWGATLRVGLSRSEEHTSELQSLMRISYAVFCLKKKTKHQDKNIKIQQ